MTLIYIGVVFVAIAMIAALANLLMEFANESGGNGVFVRHFLCAIVMVVGIVLVAFGILQVAS